MTNEQVQPGNAQEDEKQALNKRLETIGWALLKVM